MKSPVALLFFNRPEPLARVFEVVRVARPETLLLVADGPRPERKGELAACERARAVAQAVDWPCRVLVDFSDHNLGCRRRIASGLDWVFSQVDEAVVLEDDCLPDPSFFAFCDEMLERYRNDARVMAVSGSSYHQGTLEPGASYYLTRYPHIWGWATWRRAWAAYDVSLAKWTPRQRAEVLHRRFDGLLERFYWAWKLARCAEGRIDTWDYQWAFAQWAQDGLCIIPERNLVQNIGFGGSATHTFSVPASFKQEAQALSFPLRHPGRIRADREVEALTWKRNFRPRIGSWLRRRLFGND